MYNIMLSRVTEPRIKYHGPTSSSELIITCRIQRGAMQLTLIASFICLLSMVQWKGISMKKYIFELRTHAKILDEWWILHRKVILFNSSEETRRLERLDIKGKQCFHKIWAKCLYMILSVSLMRQGVQNKEETIVKWPNLYYSFLPMDCCVRINGRPDCFIQWWYSVINILIVTTSISKRLYSWLAYLGPSEHHYTTQTSKFNNF